MGHNVIVPKPVQKQLDKIPEKFRTKILEKIITLKNNPRPLDSVKLKGFENEYRIRVGDYRMRYEIIEKESIVLLLHCKHRKDVYKQ